MDGYEMRPDEKLPLVTIPFFYKQQEFFLYIQS